MSANPQQNLPVTWWAHAPVVVGSTRSFGTCTEMSLFIITRYKFRNFSDRAFWGWFYPQNASNRSMFRSFQMDQCQHPSTLVGPFFWPPALPASFCHKIRNQYRSGDNIRLDATETMKKNTCKICGKSLSDIFWPVTSLIANNLLLFDQQQILFFLLKIENNSLGWKHCLEYLPNFVSTMSHESN